MIKVFCDECNAEINRDMFPYELKFERHFCNKKCRCDYDKRTGHFKRMSEAGREGRARVLPQSNRDKPRRRKKEEEAEPLFYWL